MKLNIQDLVVEVTRRCNMNCAHCMRGKAQNKDLNLEKFDEFLKNVNYIDTITFTGGEPTLNINAIEHILNKCKELNVDVYNFYVVTNGKSLENQFINLMIDWYMYCFNCNGCEPEYSGVALSQDEFHEAIDKNAIAKLSALSFFHKEDKETDWRTSTLVNLGNARSITTREKREQIHYDPEIEMYDDNISISDASITFTCDGDILSDCDYEYDSTDEITICDYSNAVETFHQAWLEEHETVAITA